MRPNGTGAPPTGAIAQQPPEKYLLGPFVDRVRVVFAFSAAGPAFKAGHLHVHHIIAPTTERYIFRRTKSKSGPYGHHKIVLQCKSTFSVV